MKTILLTITTLLLLFNCSNSNNGSNEPPIPCKDGICLTDEQLNFFKEYLEDDTLTKKVLFEMSSMDLSNKSITSLDTGIFNNLTNLTELDLSDNDICIVDKADVGLENRVNLTFDVWGCLTDEQVTFFNRHIMSITTKKELYEAPTLNLSSKSITSLDTGIFNNLINVTRVDLTDNPICSVDKGDVGLENRVNLTFGNYCSEVTDAQLNFFSDKTSITTKKELYEATTLDLSNKSITSLDTGIFNNLTNLTRVDLDENALTNIPDGIFDNLTNLTWLDLHDNDLPNIPAEIGNLANLTWLWLSGNQLMSIPKEIGNLTSLTTLSLSSNKLTSIPKEIGNLTSLTQLWLSGNELANIPAEIGNLANLTTLSLGGNKLISIPAEIGNLTSLRELWLNNNNLTRIPDGIFTKLTNLTWLTLYNNALPSIPDGIFTNLTNFTTLWLKASSFVSVNKNTFTCSDAKYSKWGLDTMSLPTSFLCN